MNIRSSESCLLAGIIKLSAPIDIEAYKHNPVVTYQFNISAPIGRCVDIHIVDNVLFCVIELQHAVGSIPKKLDTFSVAVSIATMEPPSLIMLSIIPKATEIDPSVLMWIQNNER